MMRFCVLASGSKGNSIYVESGASRFLIDVGLSARQIEQRLLEREIDPATIKGIVLTHAHNDHVKGVGVFAKRYKLAIHGHPDTLDNITRHLKPNAVVKPWSGEFELGELHFTPFAVPHDCRPTHGYLIRAGRRTLAICTDIGYVTEEIKTHLQQANAMLLESNHDPEMLKMGPYPLDLQERIRGDGGHISNHEAGRLLKEIIHPGVHTVILGHLSQENNTPELALKTVLDYLGPQFNSVVRVIQQKTISPIFAV